MAANAAAARTTADIQAHAGKGVAWAARLGYAARGVVYLIIGFLALLAAIGRGGGTTGSRGALSSIQDEPFGQVLLLAIALGLVCYAIWRGYQAIKDPDQHGHDAKAIGIRAGLAVSGVTHLFLAIYAASVALGWGFGNGGGGGGTGGAGGNGGGGQAAQTWSGHLLRLPGGQWILGIVGAVVVVAGLAQIYRGYQGKYRKELVLDYKKQRWADPVCKAGLAAKGLVFALVGVMLIIAAWQHDMYEAGGLGKGLEKLQQKPYGWILLAVVALGLMAYGVFSLIEARYHKFAQKA